MARSLPTPISQTERKFARDSGTIGKLRMLSIREHRFPFLPKVGDWNRFNRNTGGTLVEKCCHFFDLMNLAMDCQAVRVQASGAQDVNHLDEQYHGETPDILDNAFVIVDYENGARACLDLCMFAEGSRFEQELVATGNQGKIECTVPGDELIAVDGRRVNASADLPLLLSVDRPAVFTYARRGCLATTQLCAVQGVERWCLSWEPAASSEQLFLRDRWFRFL